MKINFTSKFVMLVALSLLIAGQIFGQGVKTRSKTSKVSTWKTYTICQDSVRAAFPVAPVEQLDSGDLGGGEVLTTRTNRVSSGSSVYMVTCFDGLPMIAEKMSPEMKKTFFEFSMKSFAEQMETLMLKQGFTIKVKLLAIRETLVAGRPAYEQDFTIGPLQGKAKMTLYGNRGVWNLAMIPNGTAVKDRTTFFSSLEILANQDPLLKIVGKEM